MTSLWGDEMKERIVKKERNLMINSHIIDEHPWLKELLLNNEKISIDDVAEEYKNDFRYVVPYIIKQCGDEWRGDESVLHPIEDLGEERRPCSLCGTGNRYIYYIQNKLNGRKMNVGKDCVEEFVDLSTIAQGVSKSKLIKKAQEIRRMSTINKRFPGIQNRIDTWENRLNRYSVVIPSLYEEPHSKDGERLNDMHSKYLRGDYDESVFDDIESILSSEASYIDQFDSYTETNVGNPFIATKKIINWLEIRNDYKSINTLKTIGFITVETISSIWEPEYVSKQKPIIEDVFESIGATVLNLDQESNVFVLKIGHSKIKLACRFEKFFSHFGQILLNEKPKAAFSLANIIRISESYDLISVYTFIEDFKKHISKWGIGFVTTDSSIDQNKAYLKDKQTKKYVESDLSELFNRFKGIVLGMDKPTRNDLELYISSHPGKKYTREQLKDLNSLSRSLSQRP
jgi:hypothetical protein